ncbi:MAG: heme A synthase, partial [bacterium]|nr:heme A synthase [bacterium]
APVWMQLVHLLLSDIMWVVLVLLAASALSAEEASPQGVVAVSPATSVQP